MAHCRHEPRVVQIVRVPSVEEEDARRRSRERERLITEQTAHINRIKGLLRLVGLPATNPRRRNWIAWLDTLRRWQGQPMPHTCAARSSASMRVCSDLRAVEGTLGADPSVGYPGRGA